MFFQSMEVDIFNITNWGYSITFECDFVHNGTSNVGIEGTINGHAIWIRHPNTEFTNNGTLNIGDTDFLWIGCN